VSVSAPNLQQLVSSLPKEMQGAMRSAFSAQDGFNAKAAGIFNNLPSWTTPLLTNSWVAYRDSSTPQVIELPIGLATLVFVMGAIKSGTLNTTAFTLATPPMQELGLSTDSNGAFGELVVQTTGAVIPRSGSNAYFSVTCAYVVT
jgi:hypothetical protein